MRVLSYFVLTLAWSAMRLGAAPPQTDSFTKFPVSFALVNGQPDRYAVRVPGYTFGIQARENTLTFLGSKPGTGATLRARFLGARQSARLHPSDRLPFPTSYFIGRSPSNWRTGTASYGKVSVDQLYRGIDLLYYGTSGQLEYDFLVHPGGDPSAIDFEILGATSIRVENNGELVLASGGREFRWKAPTIYQASSGGRVEVAGGFQLISGNQVRFRIGKYDRACDLIIDPVLSYESYLGSSGRDWSRAVATDASGNVYVTGLTAGTDLKTTAGAVQPAFGGKLVGNNISGDAFVAKFTSAGVLTYLTFLGGHLDDFGFSIAADSAGNAFVTGMTNSSDFPVTQAAYQTVYGGGGGNSCQRAGDAFLTKLNPTGTQLVYSTYLGGRQDDFGSAVAVDATGNAYVTGFTISFDFPTTQGAYSTALSGRGGQTGRPSCDGMPWFNTGDAFVTKFNASGSQIIFSTYLGGKADDAALAIAVDSSQNVFVGGFTLSRDYPITPGAFQKSYQGVDVQNFFFNTGDGFVTKLNSTGTALVYSTYLGGIGDDGVTGLALAPDETAWVTGSTSSSNFPVVGNAIQKHYGGYLNLPFEVEQLTGDAFATHLNASGTAALYSTFLGGSQNDLGGSIRVDASGLVYVSGFTDSTDFPVSANAAQKTFGGDGMCSLRLLCGTQYFQFGDGFVTVIDANAAAPVYSTFLGGTRDDTLLGLALDGSGGAWAAGGTHSSDNASTANASQKSNAGRTDAWLLHLTGLTTPGPVLSALVNSASNAQGGVSAGMIFTGYGSLLGPDVLVGAALDSSGRLANTRSDVTITFDGLPAPIVYVSANQIAGVVPYGVAGKTSTQVMVQYNGQTSPPLTVPVVPAAPGLFSTNFSGSGPAVAFNQDGSLNSATNPAAKGSAVVLFGTGEGQTIPPGSDGLVAVPGALTKPTLSCTATVGATDASVLYCGSVPFVVEGELQLNLQLSPSTPSGSQTVVLSIGSFHSAPNLTIFVQ
jgi:uncharacterized protein (TIGR03437 family)